MGMEIASCQLNVLAIFNPSEYLVTRESSAAIFKEKRDEVFSNKLHPKVIISGWPINHIVARQQGRLYWF